MAVRIEQYEERIDTPAGRIAGAEGRSYQPYQLDLEGFGRALEGIAQHKEQAELNNARADLAAKEPEALLAFNNEMQRIEREWVPGQMPPAEQISAYINTYTSESEKTVANPKARELMRARSNDLRASYMIRGAQFQNKAETDYRVGQYGTAYQNVANLAATDPLALGPQLAQINASVMADTQIPALEKAEFVRKQSQAAAKQVARVQAESNPETALAIASSLLGITEPTLRVSGGGDIYAEIVKRETGNRLYDAAGQIIRGPAIKTKDGQTIYAYGKYQLLESTAQETAKDLGVPWNRELFFREQTGDPAKDAETAAYHDLLGKAYIDQQQQQFGGNPILIAAAHNMGPEATKGWAAGRPYQTQSGKWWHPKGPMDMEALPEETRKYVEGLGTVEASQQKPAGLVEGGNIDLGNRPVVNNADGTISTVRSISIEEDGNEVLIPTVSDDGRILTDQQAVAQYRSTGKHLGKFDSVEHANTYAKALHEGQAERYAGASMAQSESALAYRLLDTEDLLAVRSAAQSRLADINRQNEAKLAVDKALFDQHVTDLEVAAKNGDPIQIPTDGELVTFMGPAKAALTKQRLLGYQQMAGALKQLPGLSNGELTAITNAPDPEGTADRENRQFIRDTLSKQAQATLAARQADPGKAALDSSPAVRDAYSAWQGAAQQFYQAGTNATSEQFAAVNMAQSQYVATSFAQQRQWGIVEPKLANDVVAGMADGFRAQMKTDPVAAAARFAALPAQLGSFDALQQVGQKTGALGWFAMEQVPAPVLKVLQQAQAMKPEEVAKLMPHGIKPEQVKTAVSSAFAPLLGSFSTPGPDGVGDNATATRYYNAGLAMANQYLISGEAESPKVAARMAYQNLYADRETVVDGVRIPNNLDPGKVSEGLRRRKMALPAADLFVAQPSPGLTIDETRERVARTVRERGSWVTNETGTGAYLMIGGRPVMSAAGKPIRIAFTEAASEQRPFAERQREAALHESMARGLK